MIFAPGADAPGVFLKPGFANSSILFKEIRACMDKGMKHAFSERREELHARTGALSMQIIQK